MQQYLAFDEHTFRRDVNEALCHVKKILNVQDQNTHLAENVDHNYSDKYDLANIMTNLGIITQMNCLEKMGLTVDILKGLDKTREMTLRFQAFTKCTLVKENEVEVPLEERTAESSIEEMESDLSCSVNSGGGTATTKTKAKITRVVKRVKEYVWKVDVYWEVFIYSGVDATTENKKIILQNRKSSANIITQSSSTINKEPPLINKRGNESPQIFDVSLTWLLQQIDTNSMVAMFNIDRTTHTATRTNPKKTTKTPLRNEQVEDAMNFMHNLLSWADKVDKYIRSDLENGIDQMHNPALGVPSEKGPKLVEILSSSSNDFSPIQPFMKKHRVQKPNNELEIEQEGDSNHIQKSILDIGSSSGGAAGRSATKIRTSTDAPTGVLLSKNDLTKVINEHVRLLEEKTQNFQRAFPAKHLAKIISIAEAEMVFLCNHMRHLCLSYSNSMQYIEKMLERQLIAAIGKRVNSSDLDKFVRFHNGKLLNLPPKSFCHSVRRPNHYPDGLLSIEGIDNSKNVVDKRQPIDTFVRKVELPESLKMSLNAATTVELTGETYLHGWLQHRFKDTSKKYELIARARQFSSFMLVVGTMMGSNELDPKDAIILQNKDEVIIPLLLDELPSAKEFKDAIKSLSPEQQRFAMAFRSMQLESSVLGVCIIQIKPQLETLLNLPYNALTKEMKLTQELMELFIEHQVPSDLISYDGDKDGASAREKFDVVRGLVSSVIDTIDSVKKNKLEEKSEEADMPAEMDISEIAMMLALRKKKKKSKKKNKCKMEGLNLGGKMRCKAPLSCEKATPITQYMTSGCPDSSKETADVANTAVALKANQPASGTLNNRSAHGDVSSNSKEEQTTDTPNESQPMDQTEDTADFTMIPKTIDFLVEKHDSEGSLRSTVIKTANKWTRYRQENLLSKIHPKTLSLNDIQSEKNKAFDLLDAMSRSGALPISCSELHVIICLTHRFDKDVMGTVIEDNINPIEKLEKSTLLFASAIHGGVSAGSLIRNSVDLKRLSESFPTLILKG